MKDSHNRLVVVLQKESARDFCLTYVVYFPVICRKIKIYMVDMQLTFKVTSGVLLQRCSVALQVEREKHGFIGPCAAIAQHIFLIDN